ncbi:MAG: hypothetical protein M1339_00120 [Bacteroidetes bacterium]|nr:hypothetical protein [Bacteroidota bacterium]
MSISQDDMAKKGFIDLDWRAVDYYESYNYDAAGRLETVEGSQIPNMSEEDLVASYEYYASGKPRQLTLGSTPAATIAYNYNERDWLTSDSSNAFWEHL